MEIDDKLRFNHGRHDVSTLNLRQFSLYVVVFAINL